MFCWKCGSPLEEDQKFCTRCGAALTSDDGPGADAAGAAAPVDPAAETVTQPLSTLDEGAVSGFATDEDIPEGEGGPEETPAPAIGLGTDEEPPVGEVTGFATDDTVPEAPVAAPGPAEALASDAAAPVVPAGETVPVATQPLASATPAAAAAAPAATQVFPASRPVMPPAQNAYNGGATYGAGTEEPKQGKASKIAAIVLSILAVIAVIAVIAVVGLGLGPGKPDPALGDEPTECTMISRIYPTDENGNPLQDYTVTIVDRLTGEEVAKADIKNGEGFTPDELKLDPNRRYSMTTTDNTGTQRTHNDIQPSNQTPPSGSEEPVVVPPKVAPTDPGSSGSTTPSSGDNTSSSTEPSDSTDPSDSTVPSDGTDPSDSTEPSDSTNPSNGSGKTPDSGDKPSNTSPVDKKAAMYKSYLDTLNKLIEKYGKGEIKTVSGGAVMTEGVSFAKLIDLDGDGTEEFMAVYFDESKAEKMSMNDPRAYFVEVWAYDGKEAKSIYSHAVDSSNGGFAFLSLYKKDNAYFLAPISFGGSNGKVDMVTEVVTFAGTKVNKVEFAIRDSYSSNPTYEMDGKEVDEKKYQEALDAAKEYTQLENYSITMASSQDNKSDDKVKRYTAQQTLDTVKDTTSKLEEGAKGSGTANEKSSGAAASASLTEASVRKLLESDASGWGDVLYVFVEDFDQDGTTEALAVMGKATGDFENEYENGHLVYVKSDGKEFYEPDFGGDSSKQIGNMMNGLVETDDGYILLSTEHDGHGSGSSSTVFGIKDGGVVVVDFVIEDVTGGFHESNGKLTGYISKFPANKGHQYEWHSFEYDYDSSTLTDTGVLETTDYR